MVRVIGRIKSARRIGGRRVVYGNVEMRKDFFFFWVSFISTLKEGGG